jgi:hypothetical protein
MKKIILTLILAVSIITLASAQDYKTGIGLRGGTSWGLTLKHFVGQKAAFEGILYGYGNGFHVAGLYEIHNTAFNVDHLKWYYGAGAHLGTWDNNTNNNFVLGVDGILGIEYSFSEAPISIGLDWNPYINLVGNTEFVPNSGALSIRYIF